MGFKCALSVFFSFFFFFSLINRQPTYVAENFISYEVFEVNEETVHCWFFVTLNHVHEYLY